jgi:hypothetical protein
MILEDFEEILDAVIRSQIVVYQNCFATTGIYLNTIFCNCQKVLKRIKKCLRIL